MLVDYSDSDASDSESPKPTPVTSEPPKKPTSGLSGLLPKPKRRQKDAGASDGPKKIVVNLPKVDDAELLDQPPSKIRRVGGGGSGLSSMLPAPKKRKEAEAAAAENEGTGVLRKPRVLGGASAGAREVGTVKMPGEGSDDEGVVETPKPAVVKGSNTMFVPQSVVAKKTIQPMSAFRKKGATGTTKAVKVAGANIAPPKPKVSLFGSAATSTNSGSFTNISTSGDYKPIMLETAKPAPRPADSDMDMDTGFHDGDSAQQQTYVESAPSRVNDLDSLVEEVGLDEAAVS